MEFFEQFGYLGIFLALLAAGFGAPIPEELPVLTAGVLVGHEDTPLRWWIMLPVCILGVVIGDTVLYGAGRFFGKRIVNSQWIQRKILSLEQQSKLEKAFHERGIWVLLGARLLPGVRTPVFIMAGVSRLPFARFILADGLYAIPGVNLLFWTAYVLTDQVLVIFNKVNEFRPLFMVVILSLGAVILFHKFVMTRKVSTGEPVHVPDIVKKPAEAMAHMVENAVERVTHRHHGEATGEHAGKHPAEAKPEAVKTEVPG